MVEELVRGLGEGGVELRKNVEEIVLDEEGKRVEGVRVGGEIIRAREGVVCNAPIWEVREVGGRRAKRSEEKR